MLLATILYLKILLVPTLVQPVSIVAAARVTSTISPEVTD